ncbi:toprim domain-containing protein [Bacillaceae bacterium S4-13-56]
MMEADQRIIIVEGKTDLKQVKKILEEDIDVICTYGTLGVERLEEMIEEYQLDELDVYILVDEDESGQKLRKQLSRELPHAQHIFIDKSFREVATTPLNHLAVALLSKNLKVKTEWLK